MGPQGFVDLLEAVDHELTLLRLGKHTNRELLPFRLLANAATPASYAEYTGNVGGQRAKPQTPLAGPSASARAKRASAQASTSERASMRTAALKKASSAIWGGRLSTTDASQRAAEKLVFSVGRLLDRLSRVLPGSVGKFCEGRAQRLYLRAFQGNYDVVIGYLIAHHELLEEELSSPSSFALNAEVNGRSVEMVEQNIKAANIHLSELKADDGQWCGACSVLDTVRVTHVLMNALEEAVTSMGHHGSLAETETERLLDLILERKEWLRQQTATISSALTASMPGAMLAELTQTGRRRRERRSQTSLVVCPPPKEDADPETPATKPHVLHDGLDLDAEAAAEKLPAGVSFAEDTDLKA